MNCKVVCNRPLTAFQQDSRIILRARLTEHALCGKVIIEPSWSTGRASSDSKPCTSDNLEPSGAVSLLHPVDGSSCTCHTACLRCSRLEQARVSGAHFCCQAAVPLQEENLRNHLGQPPTSRASQAACDTNTFLAMHAIHIVTRHTSPVSRSMQRLDGIGASKGCPGRSKRIKGRPIWLLLVVPAAVRPRNIMGGAFTWRPFGPVQT